MASANVLIACPSCSCHAFARETHCPGCGALLRGPDGSLQRTAGAAFLGLTMAFAVACSSETGGGTTSSGSSASGAGGGSTSSGSSASGAGGGSTSSGSSASGAGGALNSSSSGFQTMSTYGTAASGGNFSSSSGAGGSQ